MEDTRLVVADFGVLRLARKLAIAEKSGNVDLIESAKKHMTNIAICV